MTVTARVLGFVFGEHAKNWKIMHDTWDKAVKKWREEIYKLPPLKKGEVREFELEKKDLPKYLTKEEYKEFKEAEKKFEDYWAKERAKAGLKEVV